MKFSLSHKELKAAERSVYSQGGQDGVLEAIFSQIEGRSFVEFGARDGVDLSNTANLRINHGWNGLLMDTQPSSNLVAKEYITRDNINELLIVYDMWEFDYLSIDIDGNDYWVWEKIIAMPKVVSIEYNSKFRNDISLSIEYNENHKWEGDDYYGASLLAMKKLGDKKGYTLVHIVSCLDAFFVRNDLIDENYVPPTLDELLPDSIIAHKKVSEKSWVSV